MADHVDVAVIGLGLIGSAAARSLAERGLRVAGIGPAEPADRTTATGAFASHHDSGRITRRLDAVYEWAVLASRSIDAYPRLERDSGVSFHHPCGLVFVRDDEAGIANQREVIARLGLPVTVDIADSASDPSGYHVPPGWTLLREPAPAGAIDPRRLVEAQLTLATRAGARLVRSAAEGIERRDDHWWVHVGDDTVSADRVLIATGPHLQDLHGHRLAASVRPEAVILAEVDDHAAEVLATLPSAVVLLDHPVLDDVYVVPPVRYPDGRRYLKMGGSRADVAPFTDPDAVRSWMTGSAADASLPVLRSVLDHLLPDVVFRSYAMRPCLITDTPTGLPYVGAIEDRCWVAAGGNGHAAKSSDAIGELAAALVADGSWGDAELSEDRFAPRFGAWSPGPGSRHGN